MPILWNPISEKSSGGTELLCRRIEESTPAELLDQVQIVPSRLYGELDPTKIRILYLHDLPPDPESRKILSNEGWRNFHRVVCVSNWQAQRYIEAYNIPWSHVTVIANSIYPIESIRSWRSEETVNFIYHTTPHRGLDILYSVFDELYKTHKNIHLNVYSSFNIYGWGERDAEFQQLFDNIKAHEAMTYHGSQSNEVVREALKNSDFFAYPNTWPETSCMALMEAMSAGIMCVHPNFGALSETAANWTMMYQWHEDKNQHAGIMYGILDGILKTPKEPFAPQLANQKQYADIFYNWNNRQKQWVELIGALSSLPRELPKPSFRYKTA